MKVSVIGTGNIAHTMARTIAATSEAEFYAVASRDLASAEKFAAEFGIPVAYGSYDELIDDPNVGLVYISTIHPLHYPIAKKLLERGRSVLCEKPITLNRAQAEDLFKTARENNAFICEAVWTRFFPWVEKIKEITDGGEIGKPILLDAKFGLKKDSPRLHRPELGGGALLDLGIYNITAADLLLGRDFEIAETSAILSESGIDTHSFTLLKYPDGRCAYLSSSVDMVLDSKVRVYCDGGYIEIVGPSNWKSVKVFSSKRELIREITPEFVTGYEFELKACIEAIERGEKECAEIPHDTTLFVMGVMDELRKRWGVKYPNE